MHGNSSCFMTPSLGVQAPIQTFSIFPFYVSILSPTLFQGAYPVPVEPWGFLLLPKGGFVAVILYLDEFLEVDFGGGWPSLHLTPLPSFSVLYLGFIYLFFPPVPDL